ncbi:hypothetical protein QZH41_014679, partial [Actinostola sp. cb2023]
WFWGDPHIVTMDNKNYTFNGLGEYTMVDVNNADFQLQARTAKAPGDEATVFSAAAAKDMDSGTIEVRLNNVMPCTCASGYTGKFCESDIDACEMRGSPCFPGVQCNDLPPPSGVDGYKCGPCPEGYSGDGATCADIS